ncbi:MAG: formate dehydrogenase accessory sulfurtransferase FdhD [Desulfomonilia bacterium]
MKKEPIENSYTRKDALLYRDGSSASVHEAVCVEKVFSLVLNDESIGRMVASPHQLKELGAGFVISEGLAHDIGKVEVDGDRILVYSSSSRKPGGPVTESSGGISLGTVRTRIASELTIDRDDVFRVIGEIASELWEKTGGAHCSVLFSENRIVAKCSDIGRHNTVDKVIGHAILEGIELSGCILGCTGRQPAGMVSKAINAGIPIVISKAATTDEGIHLARAAGLTLICRVREHSFCVYSHPERIANLTDTDPRTPRKKRRSCRKKT